jgi:hypothetical protein
MIKHVFSVTLLAIGILLASTVAFAVDSKVPEPFQGFDATSKHRITYDDLNKVLKLVVVDSGRSNREKAEHTQAKTGTRMKVKVQRSTINEGNRVYYEIFRDEESARQVLQDQKKSLLAEPVQHHAHQRSCQRLSQAQTQETPDRQEIHLVQENSQRCRGAAESG